MCRQPFSIDQLEQQNIDICQESDEKIFKWFYEGKTSGYWAFDERSNLELENAYNDRNTTEKIVISIAGFAYCIDFTRLIQYPVKHPERIRKIKRSEEHRLNSGEFKIKGVAGLRVLERTQASSSSSSNSNECDHDDGETSRCDNLSQSLSESLRLS
jgi:E3 ubiquitin-protein ligase RNF146